MNSELGTRNSKLTRYWLPPLSWAVLIFSFSSIPNPPVPHTPGLHMDKMLHMIGYGMLASLLFRAFATGEKLGIGLSVFLTIVFSIAYAMSDETHQFFVGRECDLGDLLADILGATITAVAFAVWIRRRRVGEPSEYALPRAEGEKLDTLKREL